MHPLEKKINALVRSRKLFAPGARLILAVSGGPDSMAMLHLLAACRQELDCTLHVVYVDHGLRPTSEVEGEKRLVAEQAGFLGLIPHFKQAAVKDHARRYKLSIEDAGRQLRYAILREIAGQQAATRIAVAHTADDQAEEMVLRLIRGSGRKGLSGMRLLRDNLIIRPLLLTPKKELLSYLEDKKIPFANDSTNANPRYLRNRVRHRLLPLLEKDYNPNIRQVLRNTAAILGEEEEFLEQQVAAVFKDCLMGHDREKTLLPASLLNRQHPAIQRRILEKVLCSMSVKPSFTAIENIRLLAQSHSRDRELHLPGGLRVNRNRDLLRFTFPKGRTPWRGSRATMDEAARKGGWRHIIRQPGSLAIDEIGRVLNLTISELLPPQTLQSEADDFLDLAAISFPLVCRSQQPGDRFRPLGAPGSKKVADYLRDRKIPKEERRRIPVLESSGQIIALPGVTIAHPCRVLQKTRSLLRISIR